MSSFPFKNQFVAFKSLLFAKIPSGFSLLAPADETIPNLSEPLAFDFNHAFALSKSLDITIGYEFLKFSYNFSEVSKLPSNTDLINFDMYSDLKDLTDVDKCKELSIYSFSSRFHV